MNKVYLIGRLTKDPECRYSESGSAVARYTLAVDRRRGKDSEQQQADFIQCVAFGKGAEFVEKYLKKGTKIAVVGRIRTGSYTKQDGTKVYTTDVIADEHEFVESRRSSREAEAQETADGFLNVPDEMDENLPFR